VRRHPVLAPVQLPAPEWPDTSLGAAVRARRSLSDLGSGRIGLAELSVVLAGAAGVTGTASGPAGTPIPVRAAPSGGGLFPLDLLVLPLRCDGLDDAVRRYDPERHVLEATGLRLAPGALAGAVYQQEIPSTAAVFVAVAATFARTRVKYGLRGYRFALLEAGHVVQGALLAATAAGLRSVPVGGFLDAGLEELLGLDGVRESVVHGFAVGRPE
jgi:SagB-type dehydrogenase family enzyme